MFGSAESVQLPPPPADPSVHVALLDHLALNEKT